MFTYSNPQRHQPPSRLAGGRFLALLAVQLLAAGIGLLVSHHLHRIYEEVISTHEQLISERGHIDDLLARLDTLSQEGEMPAAEKRQRAAQVVEMLNPSTSSSSDFLLDVAARLPAETGKVRQSAAGLNDALLALTPREHAQTRPQVGFRPAVARLAISIQTLRIGVDQLDEVNFRQLYDVQQIRFWENTCEAFALLLMCGALIYGIRLGRELRQEELARFGIESELAAERSALEKRVHERTSALQAEVKERRRAERLNRGRNRALEMLARNESTVEILKVLVNTVAEYQSTWLCALHFLESGSLKLMASAGLNDKLAQHMRCIAADFADAPESAALALGRVCVLEDLAAERKPWSELLRANGLQSAWSAPFFAPDSTALGTLTVYTLLKCKPSPGDVELLEMACHMAALVLERRRLHAQLIDHAYHDSLTGLPNRRLGEDRLAGATSRADRAARLMAVLWIDLDKFKQINDVYGHPIGDAVLQQAAKRLSGRLRSNDTLARMGGDEFMAILEEIRDRQDAENTAANLLDILAQPMQIGELEIGITASIGISLYPEDGKTVDSLARNADQAMYAAKFGGFGVRSFSPAMDKEPAERRELEAELSRALDEGGFTIAYQPQCLANGALVGFEALLRFHSPRLGNIPPSRFIPIAEETQLIVPLGEWVLREACSQSRKWQQAGYPAVPIAVNISALQFARDDFSDTVAQILLDTGQSPALLELELTESIVMHDFAESARQMKRLKLLGVRIAIDDFGTGYSSLSYLHRLPIDVLKIDRSFMETLNEPDGTRPIVEAVLSMAHTLGLGVVAEGVETAEQLSTLRRNGCDVMQGFLFSPPVRPVEAAAFLHSGNLGTGAPPSPPARPAASSSVKKASTAAAI